MPRDNIDVLARVARRAAATTLAALAVVRGPSHSGGDAVERAVLALAAPDIDTAGGEGGDSTGSSAVVGGKDGGEYDIHTAAQWPGGVPKEDILITPTEARSAWKEFMNASSLAVQQVREAGVTCSPPLLQVSAMMSGHCDVPVSLSNTSPTTCLFAQAKITQQANLAAGKRAPPIWAMMMILFLGWNEFVAVVWNPIYLVLGLVGFVFGYMLYAELDVDARMQQGWVSGLLSIWSNFGDAVRNVRVQSWHGLAMAPVMRTPR